MIASSTLQSLPFAQAMRESLWLFPLVEIAHIAGFVMLVGTVFVFDLRILGCGRQIAVSALARLTLPLSLAALALVVPSGLLMFSAQAGELLANRLFLLKLILIMAAGVNALIFHIGPFRAVAEWNIAQTAPPGARLMALLSLLLWLSVIACGRLLAYV